ANRRGGCEQKPVKGRHCEEASPTKQSRATGTSLAPLDCLAATKIEARSKCPLSQLCASPHLTLALSAPRGGEGGTRVAGGRGGGGRPRAVTAFSCNRGARRRAIGLRSQRRSKKCASAVVARSATRESRRRRR